MLNNQTFGAMLGIFDNIKRVIPDGASTTNQLADKSYVDDSINASSAWFRGSFVTLAALLAVNWQTADEGDANYVSNNDYAFVEADETHGRESWRYTYVYQPGGQNNGWTAQYRINEASFTQAQLDAINSGITSEKVAKIGTIAEDFSTSKAYSVGECVFYGGKLYRFDMNHSAGAWDVSEVSETSITGEIARKQDVLTFDDEPTIGSRNPVTSEGIKVELDALKSGNIYGFHIDAHEPDPSACVTYLKDAVGKTPAGMDYANDAFNWGGWRGAFFLPRPCMLRYDGAVDYYLDPDDYSKRADGVTPSDVANDAYQGNAMMEWGRDGKRIWVKIVPDAEDSASASVYIADYQADEGFRAWPFVNAAGELAEHFYTPIYNGTLDGSGRLRSVSGKTHADLCQGKTAAEEVAAAELNNLSTDKLWYTETYADVVLINLLLILMGKSLNAQAVFGRGCTGRTANATSMLGTGTMDDKGMFWGNESGNYGVKVFGMENWWGNQGRRFAGLALVGGVYKYKLTRGTEDGSSASDYVATDVAQDYAGYLTGETLLNNSGPTVSGYIVDMTFTNYVFLPKTFGGALADSARFWSDFIYVSYGIERYAIRGGTCDIGLMAGPSFFNIALTSLFAKWNVGAALTCRPSAS